MSLARQLIVRSRLRRAETLASGDPERIARYGVNRLLAQLFRRLFLRPPSR